LEISFFFIRIEDVDGRLSVPGNRDRLLLVAAEGTGWGLVDARSGMVVDPVRLVSEERIEISDWELQDFAVQIVRDHLEKTGKKLMSWQSNPAVSPSIWFIGEGGPEWVVVQAVRYPSRKADLPANWNQIVERCARIGKAGHFASVGVANADDALDASGTVSSMPLWRGHAMAARFEGLVAGPSHP
jgi:hypothetical protein